MATFILSAMALGFLGSFHCVGMCGPLALSLPVQHLQGFRKPIGILIYNAGRAFTYFFLGIFFGFIGMSFRFFASQQMLSLILGSILLLFFILSLLKKRILKITPIQNAWNRHISGLILPLFKKQNFSALFLIGTLNGLLPCGLVYLAIAGGLASGNIIYSGIFMAFFGMGTMPAMIMVSYAGGMISMSLRNRVKKSFPYILGIMGLLLVIRGLNLDIPYLSPAQNAHKQVEICH